MDILEYTANIDNKDFLQDKETTVEAPVHI
jgi:hypothetical protein